ncbi:unnamed protein product [Phaeothamnion confervicola]
MAATPMVATSLSLSAAFMAAHVWLRRHRLRMTAALLAVLPAALAATAVLWRRRPALITNGCSCRGDFSWNTTNWPTADKRHKCQTSTAAYHTPYIRCWRGRRRRISTC